MKDAARVAVDRLLELVPPPTRRTSSGDWSEVEADLRVPLPKDFVELATAWGEGYLADHVNIIAPDRFLERSAEMLTWEREAREASDDPGPRLWPVLGGLLPWADTGSGDQLWWKTGGPSDTWTVASQEARSDEIAQTSWTTAEALLAFIEGRTTLFGEFDTSLRPWFMARRDQVHIEWRAPASSAIPGEEGMVAVVAEVLPIAAARGGWSDGTSFQRHWVTGEDEWQVTVETRGLRLTCPIDQEEGARRAAAEVAGRLSITWEESWVSRDRRDEV